MRVPFLALVLLSASMAGCLTGDQADGDDAGDSRDSDLFVPGEDDGRGDPVAGDPNGSFASAPTLAEGLVWTYELSGASAHADELGVVVARANASGYLFAGRSPADLAGEVHADRPWLGAQSADLNPTDHPARLLDFPLVDGKTWSWGEGEVTASRGEVPSLDGTARGFEMTVDDGGVSRTWTYAPDVGYLTSYRETSGGTTLLELALADLGTRSNATWYRSIGSHRVDGAGAPGSVAVGSDADALVLGLAGDRGSQATVSPPATSGMGPTLYQVQDATGATYDRHPPAEGDWQLSSTPPPNGSMQASLTSVAWTEIRTSR